jgi:hypothetical protein
MEDNMMLRQAMLGNALFSGVCAIGFLGFSQNLSVALGLPVLALQAVAMALLSFVGLLLFGVRTTYTRLVGQLAVWLDWAWVLGSVAAMFFLGATAQIAVLAVALAVAGFAVWQQKGLAQWRSI